MAHIPQRQLNRASGESRKNPFLWLEAANRTEQQPDLTKHNDMNCPKCGEYSLHPGTRFTKNGVSVDVVCVKDGEVYVRRWPKGVESQPFFANCIRMPIENFVAQVRDAQMEAGNDEQSN